MKLECRTQIAILCAGGRPADLTVEESLAADVASALMRGGVLPAPTSWLSDAAHGGEPDVPPAAAASNPRS